MQHAFESDHVHTEDRERFSASGDLGSLTEEAVQLVFETNHAGTEKKLKSLGKRGERPAMPGAIAKKAATQLKRIGVRQAHRKSTDPGELLARWGPILRARLDADPAAKKVLLDTGKKVLVHFDFRAQSCGSLEGGTVDKETGVVCGQNLNGRILMTVRSMFEKGKF